MKVVIIEDELPAVERLKKLLYEYDAQIEVAAILDTVSSSVYYFKNNPQPDLIFLDIELGDGKSFDIFTQVDISSYIIFITAFNEYAIRAFKYNSIDYLLKPIKNEDLQFALNKYEAQASSPRPAIDLTPLLNQLQVRTIKEYKSRFLVKRGSRFQSVEAKDIAHIYTRNKVHFIKTKEGVEYIIDTNLDDLEQQLSPHLFYRANRQFIIQFSTITEVVAWFNGKLKISVKPEAFEDIIVSRLKATEFKEWLDK